MPPKKAATGSGASKKVEIKKKEKIIEVSRKVGHDEVNVFFNQK